MPYRTAMAGVIAAEKVMAYLETLRYREERRSNLGRALYEHRVRPMPTGLDQIGDYAMASAQAIYNSGLQEVAVHFICNCVMHVHKLLTKAAEGAGYTIPADDLAVLNAYRDLRNYYEHIDERLPGRVHAGEVVRETSRRTSGASSRVSRSTTKDESSSRVRRSTPRGEGWSASRRLLGGPGIN